MGLLDKILGNDEPAKKADFSDVQSGSSSTAPAPVQTSSAGASTGRTYTVVSGDSLSKIAKHQYGDAAKWHAIYEANRDKIKNPDLIHPGQVLTIPDIS
jgi:nucleoid-associated protein YgaU